MPRKRRRPTYRKPPLTVAQVLKWADDFKRRRGRWPHTDSGRIRPLDETWQAINMALACGRRGLPGGSSLAKLLAAHRGKRNPRDLPSLSERQIVQWARTHLARNGKVPNDDSGPIYGVPGETWAAIDHALIHGRRGLPGRSSLSRLLARHGMKLNIKRLPPLKQRQILAWADAHFERHGEWPSKDSGTVAEARIEKWMGIDTALRCGLRGLPGLSSLTAFLNDHRDLFRGKTRRPKTIRESERLYVDRILAWGKAHRRRTGSWPNRDAGPIAEVPQLNWSAVDSALKKGNRGLPGGSSLAKLFALHLKSSK